MGAVTLNADEHRQWEAAVATWPTCQTCGGNGLHRLSVDGVMIDCPDCIAGRVPQPVYIVIEGEPHEHDGNTSGCQVRPGVWQCATDTCTGSFHDEDFHEYGLVVPARWRVPVGEPCEIRAECPLCSGRPTGTPPHPEGSVLLASAATVEVLPVVDRTDKTMHRTPTPAHVCIDTPTRIIAYLPDSETVVTLDPLPVPGHHFVAVATP